MIRPGAGFRIPTGGSEIFIAYGKTYIEKHDFRLPAVQQPPDGAPAVAGRAARMRVSGSQLPKSVARHIPPRIRLPDHEKLQQNTMIRSRQYIRKTHVFTKNLASSSGGEVMVESPRTAPVRPKNPPNLSCFTIWHQKCRIYTLPFCR